MTGIVVTGPPRSGTSATARVLDLAGWHVCDEADRVGGGPNNPTGHWESRTALDANRRLYERVGAQWWCPPAGGIDLVLPDVDVAQFRSMHHRHPWLCKDPRFSITLPAWRRRLHDLAGVVLVLRRPDEVIASMQRSWPIEHEHAGALWVRGVHSTITLARGLPVAVVPFARLLTDPLAELARLAPSGAAIGAPLHRPDTDAVAGFVRPPRGTAQAPSATAPDDAWQLWERLTVAPAGFHRHPPLPREASWVEELLGELRHEHAAGRGLDMRARAAEPTAAR